ncbi:MAG: hypothetical protein E7334_01410 [Clostridiales bacterium]|nr:hypothetical protein [Clostridiales bacterium]
MNCPFCGREMEAGYVQSARLFFFARKKHRAWLNPGINDTLLSKSNFWNPQAPAFICENCKKVIVDYSER